MKLYTSRIVAEWLGVSERRVRQLRDEGVLWEARPGFYDLRAAVARYITYLRKGSSDLNDERAALTKAKREAAEMENRVRRGELLEAREIEAGLQTALLNIRSRFLALPAKLSGSLAAKGGNQAAIFDELKEAVHETLEELSDPRKLLEVREDAESED
mgnify:CR=1 FL=1